MNDKMDQNQASISWVDVLGWVALEVNSETRMEVKELCKGTF